MYTEIRLRPALLALMLGALLLWAFHADAALPIPDRAPADLTDDPVGFLSRVIRCQVSQQGKRSLRTRAEHYTPDKIATYARGLLSAVERHNWPTVTVRTSAAEREAGARNTERYQVTAADAAFAVVAIVRQQSLWVPDAVSRWNRNSDGERIEPKRNPWRRPDPRLDYGLMQLHWSTTRGWAPRLKFRELADPTINLRLGTHWVWLHATTCADFLKRKTRCRCSSRMMARGRWYDVRSSCSSIESGSIACRCLAMWRAARLPLFTGRKTTWSLAGKYVPITAECWDDPDRAEIVDWAGS